MKGTVCKSRKYIPYCNYLWQQYSALPELTLYFITFNLPVSILI